MKTTTKLKEARELCKPLRNLWLPKKAKQALDSLPNVHVLFDEL
jgi:hypothetical protein